MKNTTDYAKLLKAAESQAIKALSPFWEEIPPEEREDAVQVMAMDMVMWDKTLVVHSEPKAEICMDHITIAKCEGQFQTLIKKPIKAKPVNGFKRFPYAV